MANPNRAAVFGKAHKVLKKLYEPVEPPQRSVLEHLLFSLCLENAPYAAADKAFEQLRTGFFDWNEVRVSTVTELAEVMQPHPDASRAANHVKKTLYSIFEATYSFDLEGIKKLNLGVAQQKLQKTHGVTAFALHYVTQTTLGGHAIPLDRAALDVLDVLVGLLPKEKSTHTVSGLERAIPKNKGIEFGSLLHHLGAELMANPLSTNLHKILLEIAPDCKERLPKRQPKPAPAPAKPAASKSAPPVAPAPAGKSSTAAKPGVPAKPASAAKPGDKPKPAAIKKPAEPLKPAKKEAEPVKPAAKKEPPKKDSPAKKPNAVLQKKKPK